MLIALLVNAVLLAVVWALLRYINRRYYILSLAKRIKTVDGSPLKGKVVVLPGKTRFGNNFDVLKMTPAMLFRFVRDAYTKANGQSYLWYFLFAPMYNVVSAEDAEEIFQSTKLITKNVVYELLRPFMGDGLLISTDRKWHIRRKMLTPAFHFNILQEFLDIFKEECNKFVDVLYRNVDNEVDLSKLIPQFTLNNVCETALGVKLDDMIEGAQYREAIHALETVMVERACNPLMYYLPIFYLYGSYKKHTTNLKLAHDFASRIIKRKRSQSKQQTEFKSDIGKKQRYAMLDTLLEAENEGLIDHQGICDEVNTFMCWMETLLYPRLILG
ncbi:PREDICTED: probable cytochrome P450 4ac1 [Drosophila arizonae]|uniref:Probable cytochrome P450 4ac1 n=1 Tax=Drosophila arizonae TaxID=7263 RepID=A0ABM1Q5J0_DROAR|nr:PREDICTED: probable cytochrome P450 4ac1 [Drosophila arizonae]